MWRKKKSCMFFKPHYTDPTYIYVPSLSIEITNSLDFSLRRERMHLYDNFPLWEKLMLRTRSDPSGRRKWFSVEVTLR